MYQPLITVDDFRTYLSLPDDADLGRVEQILRLAQSLCESIISPLPSTADVVIMDVATRAWTNPDGAQSISSNTGPYGSSKSYTASTGGTAGGISGGLYLTRENKRTLRRLGSAAGGVFAVDLIPATAGQALPWWDFGSGYNPGA